MALRSLLCSGWLAAVLLGASVAATAAAEPTQQVLGNWLTQDRDGIIQISRASDGSYQGRIVGGDDPGGRDNKNPDLALRSRPLRGTVIMHGLRYAGDGHWTDGTIYDPDSGHNYHCSLELVAPDRLKIHGYIGIPLLGRSQTWTRYLGTSMDLPKSGVTR